MRIYILILENYRNTLSDFYMVDGRMLILSNREEGLYAAKH